MTQKNVGLCGVIAALLFVAALVVLGALRPGYSHVNQAVSELGALGAPGMLAWNILGFGIPGALLALFGWKLGRDGYVPAGAPDWIAAALLAAMGLSLLFSGLFPADMNDLRGAATQRHIVASLLGMLWVPGAFVWAWRQRRQWPLGALVSVAAGLLFILSLGLNDMLPRGLEQRVRFGIALVWALVMGLLAVRRASAARGDRSESELRAA